MEGSIVRPLSGWGRFPVETCRMFRPEKMASLPAILASGLSPTYIARGLGRSYGDAALNDGGAVIGFERLNRLLAFDPSTGVLECESGVGLAEIVETFLPRGYFLPVTPGTQFATLGGAIAHDVHGKNHHRVGTISRFVLDFRLLTPGGELLHCAPDRHPDVFWATVGGAGLTGLLLTARLRLLPVETAYVIADYLKVSHVEDAIAAMRESDAGYEYSVAWIDCVARGRALGRSILMRANTAKRGELPGSISNPLARRRDPSRTLGVPWDMPSGTLNRWTVGAFNAALYAGHPSGPGHLVDFDRFFYPLDWIRGWNRLYGGRGFVQYQIAFPTETAPAGLVEVLERISASGRGSFLGVLKRFGEAGEGLLSFPIPGYTLALDLPAADGIVPFLRDLDTVVLRHGGRLYLAKDAVTTASAFAAMYPRLDAFRAIQARLDPNRRLASTQSRRLALTPS